MLLEKIVKVLLSIHGLLKNIKDTNSKFTEEKKSYDEYVFGQFWKVTNKTIELDVDCFQKSFKAIFWDDDFFSYSIY